MQKEAEWLTGIAKKVLETICQKNTSLVYMRYIYLVNGPCTFSTQPIYFSQMTGFYYHLLLLFVLTFSLLVAKVIEQSANDTQHKEARELTTNSTSRGTTACSHDSD